MKLSKALVTLKDLKSKVADAQRYTEQAVTFYEDEGPQYNYQEELEKYKQLDSQILALKVAIQATNALTKVEYQGKEIPLIELILRNASIRSDLSFYRSLLGTSISRRRGILEGEGPKQSYAEGYDKMQLRATIEQLESNKLELESALASVNLRTDLVEL